MGEKYKSLAGFQVRCWTSRRLVFYLWFTLQSLCRCDLQAPGIWPCQQHLTTCRRAWTSCKAYRWHRQCGQIKFMRLSWSDVVSPRQRNHLVAIMTFWHYCPAISLRPCARLIELGAHHGRRRLQADAQGKHGEQSRNSRQIYKLVIGSHHWDAFQKTQIGNETHRQDAHFSSSAVRPWWYLGNCLSEQCCWNGIRIFFNYSTPCIMRMKMGCNGNAEKSNAVSAPIPQPCASLWLGTDRVT